MKQITQTVLMVRPENFGYNAETAVNNAFQQKQTEAQELVKQKSQQEFDGFVQQLREAGVEVIVVQDTENPIKPDAVFPNNWFSTDENGRIILYGMYAQNRRLERRSDIKEILEKHDFEVSEIFDFTEGEHENIVLEGTGSLILDKPNRIAYACYSPRTDKQLFEKWCAMENYEAIGFNCADENGNSIYHTNVMMCVGEGFAVICSAAVTNENERKFVLEKLKSSGKEIIDISFEQMNQFAGNMLQVQGSNASFLVMSAQAYQSLSSSQIQRINIYTQILSVPIYTIEKYGGGSARCMMAEIYNPKKKP